jgi:predicted nucleic acid-binding protein
MLIHLDTNLLIALSDGADPHREAALRLMQREVTAGISALAWWEFECGPVSREGISLIRRLLVGGIVPFDQSHAHEAARLFNATGRARRMKFDSLIAASAILSGAEFATANPEDFRPFVAHGLRLVAF